MRYMLTFLPVRRAAEDLGGKVRMAADDMGYYTISATDCVTTGAREYCVFSGHPTCADRININNLDDPNHFLSSKGLYNIKILTRWGIDCFDEGDMPYLGLHQNNN